MSRPVRQRRVSLMLAALSGLICACSGADRKLDSASPGSAADRNSRRIHVRVLPKNETPAPFDHAVYTSLPEALRNLDFEILSDPKIPPEAREFGRALELLFSGKTVQATVLFEKTTRGPNAALGGVAGDIHSALLLNAGRYRDLHDETKGASVDPDPWLAALSLLPPEEYRFVETPATSKLTVTPYGPPMVDLVVEGRPMTFILDTGAAFSTIRRKLARELGVEDLGPPVQIGTSTDKKITGHFGVVHELRVGQAVIRDHGVLILEDENMTFKLLDGRVVDIAGVLGWNAIRNLAIVLDFPGRSFRIRKPEPRDYGTRNFFWLGYPLVRLTAANGQRLLFGYDSGSRNTSVGRGIFKILTFPGVRTESQAIGGHAGVTTIETEVIDGFSLILDGLRYDIPDVRREDHDDAKFVNMTGVLGSDIAQQCIVTIDFQNSYYGMRLSEGIKTESWPAP